MRKLMYKLRWLFILALTSCVPIQTGQKITQPQTPPEFLGEPVLLKRIPSDKLKEDLDFLFKTVGDVHPNMYAYISEAEFAKHRAALYKQVNAPMTRVDFYRVLAPTIAQLRSGHTQVYPFLAEFQEHLTNNGAIFPISLSFDGKRVVLTKNLGPQELPVGGAVLEINGKDALREMSQYASYFAAECRDANPMVLQQDNLLYCLLWLDYGYSEPLRLKIRSAEGTTATYTLKPVPYHEIKSSETQKTSREPDLFVYRSFPGDKAGLVTVRHFTDYVRFQTFLQETFTTLKAEDIKNLIIDVRGNPGGNDKSSTLLLTYITDKPIRECDEFGIKFSPQYCNAHSGVLEQFQKQLPEKDIKLGSYLKLNMKDFPQRPSPENPLRFRGRIYVLIDSGTASTSVMFASAIKGMGIGQTVGTETMDTTSLYGESFPVTLPNTGLETSVACKYFLLVGGRADGRGVVPDCEVKQTPEDAAKGVDTVLQFTLDLIREKGREGGE